MGKKFFLIGFMGAGKTTVGKYAARANGLTFLDLDKYLEMRLKTTIPDIFHQYGEEGFRKREREILHEVISLDDEDYLISTGGGTPCFFDNMPLMNKAGVTIYLDLSAGRLTDRLRHSKTKRPLITNLGGDLQVFVHKKLMERADFYSQAKVILPEERTGKKEVAELIKSILTNTTDQPAS